MSLPDFAEYRTQIKRLAALTAEARQIAVDALDEGYDAKNVRANLYNAIKYLNAAAERVDRDLLGISSSQSTVDRQYERDLS